MCSCSVAGSYLRQIDFVSLNSRLECNKEEDFFRDPGQTIVRVGRHGCRGPTASAGRLQGSGFRVQGSGFRVQGSGFRVQGSGFRVYGSGFRVYGSGFWVQGVCLRVFRRMLILLLRFLPF